MKVRFEHFGSQRLPNHGQGLRNPGRVPRNLPQPLRKTSEGLRKAAPVPRSRRRPLRKLRPEPRNGPQGLPRIVEGVRFEARSSLRRNWFIRLGIRSRPHLVPWKVYFGVFHSATQIPKFDVLLERAIFFKTWARRSLYNRSKQRILFL